ncbi:MAG: NAD(+) synthase, partial [Lachnospiraceae bacterium]|nr:NAD(+) synthase [Lachnospiraceae bacterium]
MKDGFIKAAALSPEIRVADCVFNTESICGQIDEAVREHAKILVFPELCITGYTCGDLFWQETLLTAARKALQRVIDYSAGKGALIFAGLPWEENGKLYNVAAAFSDGRLLGLIPKRHLPNYNEFYEARHFTPGFETVVYVDFNGESVPFGMNLLFTCEAPRGLCVAAELCEDLWAPNPPSVAHAMAGANVIVNLSASDEVAGKSLYREALVSGQSARLLCGYVYASAGEGESTQDLVYGGHSLLAENGHILAESSRFGSGMICSEFDISRLRAERRRMTTFAIQDNVNFIKASAAERQNECPGQYMKIGFHFKEEKTYLTRNFDPMPFVPDK